MRFEVRNSWTGMVLGEVESVSAADAVDTLMAQNSWSMDDIAQACGLATDKMRAAIEVVQIASGRAEHKITRLPRPMFL